MNGGKWMKRFFFFFFGSSLDKKRLVFQFYTRERERDDYWINHLNISLSLFTPTPQKERERRDTRR